jgi:hypothetical protein
VVGISISFSCMLPRIGFSNFVCSNSASEASLALSFALRRLELDKRARRETEKIHSLKQRELHKFHQLFEAKKILQRNTIDFYCSFMSNANVSLIRRVILKPPNTKPSRFMITLRRLSNAFRFCRERLKITTTLHMIFIALNLLLCPLLAIVSRLKFPPVRME